MFISKILSLYRDENDILRNIIKMIYEEKVGEKWVVRKIEIHLRGRGASATA